MTTTSFTKAAKDYFGLKDGQKVADFAAELRDLTEKDRVDLAEGLADETGTAVEVTLDDKSKAVVNVGGGIVFANV